MKSLQAFAQYKRDGRKIAMVTCYDAWSARIIAASHVDCILVGDSAAMVVHGHDTTLPATTEMIAMHIAAVRSGAPHAFVIGDFPFLAQRQGIPHAVATAEVLMRAGAQAVKIEGVRGHEDVIRALVEAGVPVMGHLGLTPQSVHGLGGYKLQARTARAARQLVDDARRVEALGAFALVLEVVPAEVADDVTAALEIPTIGIGAGRHTSGQVLVLQDLLGFETRFHPRFVRRYMDGSRLIQDALDRYAADVRGEHFPNDEESHHVDARAIDYDLAHASR
jgi:3-methyl-2-oxobutanoate hydroxymethyltransferase